MLPAESDLRDARQPRDSNRRRAAGRAAIPELPRKVIAPAHHHAGHNTARVTPAYCNLRDLRRHWHARFSVVRRVAAIWFFGAVGAGILTRVPLRIAFGARAPIASISIDVRRRIVTVFTGILIDALSPELLGPFRAHAEAVGAYTHPSTLAG